MLLGDLLNKLKNKETLGAMGENIISSPTMRWGDAHTTYTTTTIVAI